MNCIIRLVLIPLIVAGIVVGYLWTYRPDCKGQAAPCNARAKRVSVKKSGNGSSPVE